MTKPAITIALFLSFSAGLCSPGSAEETPYPYKRNELRISLYAPPTIPHQLDDDDCLDCHGDNQTEAPMISHRIMDNCRQCHIPQTKVDLFKKNQWQGLPEYTQQPRAYPGAPPVIPHRIFMRENCLACHGKESRPDIIDTPHPERINCLQCHPKQQRDIPLFRKIVYIKDPIAPLNDE